MAGEKDKVQDRFKNGKDLTNNLENFGNETEILALLDSISEKIRLLEKNHSTNAVEMVNCNFKDTCYAAKSKMGPCPCELYR